MAVRISEYERNIWFRNCFELHQTKLYFYAIVLIRSYFQFTLRLLLHKIKIDQDHTTMSIEPGIVDAIAEEDDVVALGSTSGTASYPDAAAAAKRD